jgi:hypothetical protein
MDVMRLPSLKSHYSASGQTALVDSTIKALEDLQLTPQIYADHSFLVYVLTDGQENASSNTANKLNATITKLDNNWTVAVMVPDQLGVHEAKRFGFPASNILIWNPADARGVKEAGEVIRASTDQFMRNRAVGIRGTKTLFKLDTTKITKSTVVKSLSELKPSEYHLLPVHKEHSIKEFVVSWLGEYRQGSAYYQLTKPETVQAYKEVCVQNKSNGKVYSGKHARELLGLPDYEVKIAADNYSDYDIFVQSTSVNRKLLSGTKLLVLE